MAQPVRELPKAYDPQAIEARWYPFWEERGFFHAPVEPGRERFSIVIPPPNVTGSLHMGHALDNTLQDIFVRWRRMQGYNTLWLPGTDHAGIATQIRVEEELAKEGKTRHDLGRDRFLRRVWAWKEQYGGRIVQQLKRLGASCDWARERFTMDARCSRAVREVFVRLYQEGLIYQGDYIINWCPRCRTALSDIEVDHHEVDGKLWTLRYPMIDGEGAVEVATTRPETMLGDTGVAVHPDDPRHRGRVGRRVRLPLLGREIPVVADTAVDPGFGTGAVKVTPAHDPTDFEIGRRHGLPQVKVIGEDARMTSEAGPYAGLDRYAARERVLADLAAGGFLVGERAHRHAVGHCGRCGTVVEPLVSRQWFVRMAPLAGPAIRAVEEGAVTFVPERFARVYLNWLAGVRDWCISRQLWWGHRIPVWTCGTCGQQWAAVEDPVACPACGSRAIEQDPDVLDTWFSSAIWPFSTLGWPEPTPELRYFYPTNLLVTGFDIIFFWVARMIFMGLHFTGKPPFGTVLIHGLVRDALGRKMSKSLGNGVDPLEVIETYGADALRFSLVQGVGPGNDLRYHPEKVEAARNFANKLWNAARFALLNLAGEDGTVPGRGPGGPDPAAPPLDHPGLARADRWILSRYARAVEAVTRHLERHDPGEAARVLYDFVWDELCDWYVEWIKPRFYQQERGAGAAASRGAARATLTYVLRGTLELLHPFMPFVTEEIWQHLPHRGESVMLAPWPGGGVHGPARLEDLVDPVAEAELGLLIEAIRGVRNVRAEYRVQPGRRVPALFLGPPGVQRLVAEEAAALRQLAGLAEVTVQGAEAGRPRQAVSVVVRDLEVALPLAGLVDLAPEVRRLEQELAELERVLAGVEGRLANPGFREKAPPEVVAREEHRRGELGAARERLLARLAELRAWQRQG